MKKNKVNIYRKNTCNIYSLCTQVVNELPRSVTSALNHPFVIPRFKAHKGQRVSLCGPYSEHRARLYTFKKSTSYSLKPAVEKPIKTKQQSCVIALNIVRGAGLFQLSCTRRAPLMMVYVIVQVSLKLGKGFKGG